MQMRRGHEQAVAVAFAAIALVLIRSCACCCVCVAGMAAALFGYKKRMFWSLIKNKKVSYPQGF